MQSRQPIRAVSAGVRAHRTRKYNVNVNASSTATASTSIYPEELSLFGVAFEALEAVAPTEPQYEPSWRRTGRSSMAADVRIPAFLIPCSASQLMDARYKSRKFSRASAADAATAAAR